MYPEIDEALYDLFSNSTKPTLKQVKTHYIGGQKLKVSAFSLEIVQMGDKFNNETFDGEERLVNYDIVVHLKSLAYLDAQRLLRDLVKDIKEEVHSELFLFRDIVTVGDITPFYNDKGVLRTALVQLLFDVGEDYTNLTNEIGEIQIRGEIEND